MQRLRDASLISTQKHDQLLADIPSSISEGVHDASKYKPGRYSLRCYRLDTQPEFLAFDAKMAPERRLTFVSYLRNTGLLFEAGNPDHLESALRRILRDGLLRLTLGTAARQAFLREYTLDKMVDRLEAFYASLAGEWLDRKHIDSDQSPSCQTRDSAMVA